MSLDVLVSQDGDADLAGLWDWDADAPLYLVTLEGQGWMHSSASVPPPFDRWHINGQGFVHPQFAYLAQPESPPTTYLQRAELRVIYVPWCVADYDNGSGAGFPDRGVTIDDLLFYLPLFATGNTNADLDDGTATGTQDGGITIDDLLYFLTHFYEGC
ncbi:MAG: hypothetical protein IPK69_07425 [Phycisphaerales bacterium]|nr:MAG: hypothetical protein IPK69_07425 [Phycisphaerales bacterium]